MRLYVMRHGIAVDPTSPDAPSADADRPLTSAGVERTRLALHGLIALGTVVDRIVTSPLLRCAQTATLAADVLGVPRLSIETHPGLAPDGESSELCAALLRLPDDGVLLIGHSPGVDQLVSRLLGLPENVTSLKKAGVAVLQFKAGQPRCQLLGVYEPKALRRLGRVE
jgi:phosphohistidine phosphatase SixA